MSHNSSGHLRDKYVAEQQNVHSTSTHDHIIANILYYDFKLCRNKICLTIRMGNIYNKYNNAYDKTIYSVKHSM